MMVDWAQERQGMQITLWAFLYVRPQSCMDVWQPGQVMEQGLGWRHGEDTYRLECLHHKHPQVSGDGTGWHRAAACLGIGNMLCLRLSALQDN